MTKFSTPLQIAQRLRQAVSDLRAGTEGSEHADMLRAANLLVMATGIISECREELFDSHQVNGEVVVTDEIDRDAVRMLDDMDHWLRGDGGKSSNARDINADALSVLREVLDLADADGAIIANDPHGWPARALDVLDIASALESCPVCGNEERGQGGYLSCECPAA